MRLRVTPDNPLERVVLALGLAPEPIVTTQLAFTMARAISAGVELGIYDALERAPLSSEDIAVHCKLNPRATRALLGALVGCDYLQYDLRTTKYALRPVARRWLLRSSEHTLANKMVFQKMEWDILAKLETFVRDGVPMDLHGTDESDEGWRAYQLGMTDLGRLSLPEAVRRTPIPKSAEAMLDIGGSGGTYSAAFLQARPQLRSLILDLPSAVKHARPLVEALGLKDRLSIEAGNVLTADLGSARFDFVFMANVAHHFSDAQNREVANKVNAALRSGGVYCIHEIERPLTPTPKNQMGGLLDLYFAMTSQSGTWSVDEMQTWLVGAGLKAGKPIRFRTSPGLVQVWGRRP